MIIYPDPTEDDLYDSGYSPDQLASQGLNVPSDEDQAYRFSVAEFLGASASATWKSQFEPAMTVFWPCKISVGANEASNAMYEAGLSCVIVTGRINDITEVTGFALTAGGLDLSDHLAAAYMCCGQLPPVLVTERAVEISSPKMGAELKEAAEGIVAHLQSSISKLNDVAHENSGLKP